MISCSMKFSANWQVTDTITHYTSHITHHCPTDSGSVHWHWPRATWPQIQPQLTLERNGIFFRTGRTVKLYVTNDFFIQGSTCSKLIKITTSRAINDCKMCSVESVWSCGDNVLTPSPSRGQIELTHTTSYRNIVSDWDKNFSICRRFEACDNFAFRSLLTFDKREGTVAYMCPCSLFGHRRTLSVYLNAHMYKEHRLFFSQKTCVFREAFFPVV